MALKTRKTVWKSDSQVGKLKFVPGLHIEYGTEAECVPQSLLGTRQ